MELTNIDNIRELLTKNGFRFSKSMGQNFLTAEWVPEQIAEEAGLDKNTGVLEIGPGIGCLTVELSKRAGKVVSVELDEKLMPVLAETLSGCENTQVVFGDILKKNIPQIVAEEFCGMRPVVCANLPYNVTSPILTNVLRARCFESVTVMVQREVARRICADAGSADYSAFSVFCSWFGEPEVLFDVSPDCFIPQPKVTSSVIKIKTRNSNPADVCDEDFFFSIVRMAFNQRRKTLVNALSSGLSEFTKQELTRCVEDCGFSPDIRGEKLSIDDFAQISNLIWNLRQK